mgnify:CR=1 FL=1
MMKFTMRIVMIKGLLKSLLANNLMGVRLTFQGRYSQSDDYTGTAYHGNE